MSEEEKKNAGLALVKQGLTCEGSKRKKRLTVCFLWHRRLDDVSEKGKRCYDRIKPLALCRIYPATAGYLNRMIFSSYTADRIGR